MPSPEKRADLDPHDAALKRVREARGCGEPCPPNLNCPCITVTLAALGLDEPPTEDEGLSDRQYAASMCCGGDPRNCDRYRVCPMRKFQKDEPPTEAMLTCGCGAQRAHESARGQVGCPHCRTPFRAVVPPTEPPKACPTCGGKEEDDA